MPAVALKTPSVSAPSMGTQIRTSNQNLDDRGTACKTTGPRVKVAHNATDEKTATGETNSECCRSRTNRGARDHEFRVIQSHHSSKSFAPQSFAISFRRPRGRVSVVSGTVTRRTLSSCGERHLSVTWLPVRDATTKFIEVSAFKTSRPVMFFDATALQPRRVRFRDVLVRELARGLVGLDGISEHAQSFAPRVPVRGDTGLHVLRSDAPVRLMAEDNTLIFAVAGVSAHTVVYRPCYDKVWVVRYPNRVSRRHSVRLVDGRQVLVHRISTGVSLVRIIDSSRCRIFVGEHSSVELTREILLTKLGQKIKSTRGSNQQAVL